jgi:hypothetical protein
MNTKLEFTKPFDTEHARAGAPIAFSDGMEAEIIKYDRHGPQSIVVLRGAEQAIYGGYRDGSIEGHPATLVMLPLGMIAGLPVFTGDKITSPDCEHGMSAQHTMNFGDGSTWTWPAPVKVYPVSALTNQQLADSIRKHSFAPTEAYARDARAAANAAIKHAIDAGQVVIAADRTARELAIAQAVLAAATNARFTIPGEDGIDLAAVIATVPA